MVINNLSIINQLLVQICYSIYNDVAMLSNIHRTYQALQQQNLPQVADPSQQFFEEAQMALSAL